MTTAYDRRGDGSPVVMIHGLGSRMEVFDPVRDLLAKHHEVISMDLPGFGRSPADRAVAPGPVGYARWLREFLAEQAIDRPHVVGSSMGGGVALELGRMGVASRVTAFSPVGYWGRPGQVWCQCLTTTLRVAGAATMPVLRRSAQHLPVRAVVVGAVIARPSGVTAEAALLSVEGLVGAPAFPAARDSFTSYRCQSTDDLGGLADIPVTIAWGTRDLLLTHRTQSRRARELMPSARHVDLPGCGHLPFTDDPDLCASVVLADA